MNNKFEIISLLVAVVFAVLFSASLFQPTHSDFCYVGTVVEIESNLESDVHRVAVASSDYGTSIFEVDKDLFYSYQIGDSVNVCYVEGDWISLFSYKTIERVEQ